MKDSAAAYADDPDHDHGPPAGLSDSILASVNDAVIVVEPQSFVVQYWNRAAENIYGWTAAEALGQSLEGLIRPHFAAGMTSALALEELVREGVWHGEVIQHHRDGHELVIDAAVRTLHNPAGAVVGLVSINRDVTKRRGNETAFHNNEAILRAFFESTPAACFLIDTEYRVLAFNRVAQAQVRQVWQREIAVGDTVLDYLRPDNRAQFRANYQRCLAGEAISHERMISFLADTSRWYELSYVPVRTADSHICAVAFSLLDITARKQASAALWLRDRAIDAVGVGVLIADAHVPELPIIYANPAFERITGYSLAETIGRNCRFLQGPETDPLAVEQIQQAITGGNECRVRLVNYRKDGTPFWNELTISPIYTTHGALTHFIGILNDITGQVALEEQLHQAQKLESIGRLAGGVAHDFNNLIGVISGALSFAYNQLPVQHPARTELAAIEDASGRAERLVRQLLAFARRQPIDPQQLDLNDLVHNLEPMLHRLLPAPIELHVKLNPQPVSLRADAGQIEQIIFNLVLNGRDAMPDGGVLTVCTSTITVAEDALPPDAAMDPGDYALITVSDTGQGMPPEVQAHLFEPFFTTKDIGQGTGLGLATCYGIVKQHGGQILYETRPQKGTVFRVYLPVAE